MNMSEGRDAIAAPFKVLDDAAFGRIADAVGVPRMARSAGETVIVVGAGVAGAVAAICLARRGIKVQLFERDMSEQDRIVGELLQPGGVRALERLGLDDCAKEGIDSIVVDGYVVFTPNKGPSGPPPKDILLKYPVHDPESPAEYFGMIESNTVGSQQSAAAKFATNGHRANPQTAENGHHAVRQVLENGHQGDGQLVEVVKGDTGSACKKVMPKGRSFHNGRFVQELRRRCMKHLNVTVVNSTVTKLLEKDGRVVGVEYKVDGATSEKEVRTLHAPLTIVADGIWSSLRKSVDPSAKPQQLSIFVGLILEHPPMRSPLPVRGCGHVVLGEPSPILLYQISSTETRVLVDIQRPMPSSATGELHQYLRDNIAPQLPTAVQPSFLEAVDRNSIKSMPNRSLPAVQSDKRGVLLLGDALNMRHPLTGGGMTVAIRDAEQVVDLMTTTDITNDADVERLKRTFYHRRREYASTINVLANALHSVFSTPGMDPTRQDLRDACFDYLSLGGCFAAGPIGLLSGLTPKPAILATHFFMVALYGVQKYARPYPTLSGLKRMYDVLHVACRIILPLLEKEQSTVLSWWPVRTLIGMVFPYSRALTAE